MIDNNKRLGKGEICSSPRINDEEEHGILIDTFLDGWAIL